MEDAPPADRPQPEVETAASAPVEGSLAPALAVLRAVLGDLVPSGPLGPETVPASVLALPIKLAIDGLIQHAKVCNNLGCPHVPPPLRPYRRMRPEAVRSARDHVHKVLWAHPDHELVVSVREQILKKHDQVAKEISTGNLLVGDRLREVLDELGTNGPRVLAAVLWALDFKGPDAEALFRSIAPLVQDGTSRRTDPVVAQDERQVESLEARLRSAVREMKEAKRITDRALHDLQLKQQKLEKSRQELEEAQRKQRETAAELDRVQEACRVADATIRSLERDGERAAKANADVRRDLKQAQKEQRALDSERSELAGQVAAERRAVERLRLELASIPRGPDAVMAFLRTEEQRIQLERSITSGGDKIRAEREWTAYGKIERAFLDAHEQYRQPAPEKLRKKSSLRLVALGGSGEVGRSCYLVELGKHRILVDCGIKPNATEDLHPAIDRLEHLDALVLTHAHTDHIGWVPALIHKFGEIEIYCSEGTAALLPVMLEDGYGHYVRRKLAQRELAQRIHNSEAVEDAYEEKDVLDVSRFAIKCDFDEEEGLPFGDISIRFFRAGHILGAASVLIEDKSGRRIFMSGDFSSFQQLTVPAARWPDDPEEIDLLVLESTYGNRNHPPQQESRRDLLSFVREITEVRKGSVILASFGLGRAQELLKLIGTARLQGELSPSVPVHVDGMIRRINPIYRRLAQFEFPPEAFNEVSGEAERREIAHRAQDIPSIIVTTSGMLTGGPVVEYAQRLLPDARHRIVLTGFQDEGAPSKGLLTDLMGFGRSARMVRVRGEDGELVEFEAAMPAKEVKLSSHADQAGLMDYAGRLRPKHIALVHGDHDAQEVLRSCLLTIHPRSEITCGPPELDVT